MISETFSWSYPGSGKTFVHWRSSESRVVSEKSRRLASGLFWCENSRAAHIRPCIELRRMDFGINHTLFRLSSDLDEACIFVVRRNKTLFAEGLKLSLLLI
jgi:hypothetical protein